MATVYYVDANGDTLSTETFTQVTDSASAVTWGAGTYVVGADYNEDGVINAADATFAAEKGYSTNFTITGGAKAGDDMTLILVDGFTLTLDASAESKKEGFNGNYSTVAIYGQEGQTGTLIAKGGTAADGIFGSSAENFSINGGVVKAYGGDAAQISSVWYSAGNGIQKFTVNGGSVYGYGGSVTSLEGQNAACGAGLYNVTLNGGRIEGHGGDTVSGYGARGVRSLKMYGGTAYGYGGSGTNGGYGVELEYTKSYPNYVAVINGTVYGVGGNGTVTGNFGVYCSRNITVNSGANVTGIGGNGGSGWGAEGIKTNNNLTINDGIVTATGGTGGEGNGKAMAATNNINVNTEMKVMHGADAASATKLERTDTNIKSAIQNDNYVKAFTPQYVAKIGKKGYETFKEALDAVQSGETIEIVAGYDVSVEKINHYAVTKSFNVIANGSDFGGGEFFSLGFTSTVTVDGAPTTEETTTLNITGAKNLYVWGKCLPQTDGKGKVWNINLTDCTNDKAGMAGMVGIYGGSNDVIVNTSMTNCSITGANYGIDYGNSGTVTLTGCTFTECKAPVKLGYDGKNECGRQITIKDCTFDKCGSTSMEVTDYAKFAAPIGLKNKSTSGKMTVSVENVTITDTVGNNGDILIGDGRTGKTTYGFDFTLNNETEVNVKVEQAGYYDTSETTATVADPNKAQTVKDDKMSIISATDNLYVDDDWANLPEGSKILAPGKEGTYYIVGVNAFGTIQAAFDAVKSGETVNILAGEYNEQFDWNEPSLSNVKIVGETDKDGKNLVTWTGGFTCQWNGNNNTSFELSNINFVNETGSGACVTLKESYNWLIQNCEFTCKAHNGGYGWNPIAFPSGSNGNVGHTISNCKFVGGTLAIRCTDGSEGFALKVVDCDITNTNFNIQNGGNNHYVFDNNTVVIDYDVTGREGKDTCFITTKSVDTATPNVEVKNGSITMSGDGPEGADAGWSLVFAQKNMEPNYSFSNVKVVLDSENSIASNFKTGSYNLPVNFNDCTFYTKDGETEVQITDPLQIGLAMKQCNGKSTITVKDGEDTVVTVAADAQGNVITAGTTTALQLCKGQEHTDQTKLTGVDIYLDGGIFSGVAEIAATDDLHVTSGSVSASATLYVKAVMTDEEKAQWKAANSVNENATVNTWVAAIGEQGYFTLADAYKAAKSGDTVKLLVSEIDRIDSIPSGKILTIEGVTDKTTVTGDNQFSGQYLNNITLKNFKFTADSTNKQDGAIRWAYLTEGSKFTLENCEFDQYPYYSLHFDGNPNGKVVAKDTIFRDTVALAGGITAEFTNCEFRSNSNYVDVGISLYTNTSFCNSVFSADYASCTSEPNGALYLKANNIVVSLDGCSVEGEGNQLTDIVKRSRLNQYSAVAVIDGVKTGDLYTAGTFVTASIANLNTICDDSIDVTFLNADNYDKSFVYAVTAQGVKTLTAEGTLKGTIKVPADVNFLIQNTGRDVATITDGTKIYVPYDEGSQGLADWKAANIPAEATCTVSGFMSKIGDKGYYSLADAYAAAEAGDTVKIIVDTVDSIDGIPEGVTLEGVSGKTTVTSTLTGSFSGDTTIKNIKFAGESNGIRWGYIQSGTLTIDTCDFAQTAGDESYGIHFDELSGNLVVKNSTITGTVACSATTKSISFVDNIFAGKGNSGKCNINFYSDASFTGCKFSDDYCSGSSRGILMINGTEVVELNNCSLSNPDSEYKITDIIRRDHVGVAAFDATGTKGSYTAGKFVAKDVATLNAVCDASIDVTFLSDANYGVNEDNCKTLVYTVDGSSKVLSLEGTIIGKVTVPEEFALDEFTLVDGVNLYLDSKDGLVAGKAYDIGPNSIIFINEAMDAEELANWKEARDLDIYEVVRPLSGGTQDTVKTIKEEKEGDKTYTTITDTYVVNLGTDDTLVNDVNAPKSETSTVIVDTQTQKTTYVRPVGDVVINSVADNRNDTTEVRSTVEQLGAGKTIKVNNVDGVEVAGGTTTTGAIMEVTGKFVAKSGTVELNNGEGAYMWGTDEKTGVEVDAKNVTVNNDGHMVANIVASGTVTILNNSTKTYVGDTTGDVIVIGGTSAGTIEDATITGNTVYLGGTQTLVNSTINSAKKFFHTGTTTFDFTGVKVTDDKVDGLSVIKWNGDFSDSGTITVNVGPNPALALYKLADYTGSSKTKSYKTTKVTVNNADYKATWTDSDLYVVNESAFDYDTLVFGYQWRNLSYGDAVVVGGKVYYYKINAFSALEDATDAVMAGTGTVTLRFVDTEEATSPSMDMLTISNRDAVLSGTSLRSGNGIIKVSYDDIEHPTGSSSLKLADGANLKLSELSVTETEWGTKEIKIVGAADNKVNLTVGQLANEGTNGLITISNANVTAAKYDAYGAGNRITTGANVDITTLNIHPDADLYISNGAFVKGGTATVESGADIFLSGGTLSAAVLDNSGKITILKDDNGLSVTELTGSGEICLKDGKFSGNIDDKGTNNLTVVGSGNELSGTVALGGAVTIGQKNSASKLKVSGSLKSKNSVFNIGYVGQTYGTVLTVSDKDAVAGSEGYGVKINKASEVILKDGGHLVFKNDFDNNGTITVDADGEEYYLLIEDKGSYSHTKEDFGTVDISGMDGYTLLLSNAEGTVMNDLYAVKIDYSKLLVNSDWATTKVIGERFVIEDKTYFYGYNAFSTEKDAFATAQEQIATTEDGITLDIQKLSVSESGTTVKLLEEGTYTVTGGTKSDENSVALKMQGENANVVVEGFTGKLIKITGGKDANDTYVTDTLDVKDSVIGDANYVDGSGWWTFYGTTVTIDNSIVGADFAKTYYAKAEDLPRSWSVAQETAGFKFMPFAESYQKTRIGTVNSMTVTDSTLNTGFFSVSGTGLAEVDDSIVYYGSAFNVGYDGTLGSYAWSAKADPDFRSGEVATVNVKDSVFMYRGWGNGGAGYGVLIGGSEYAGKLNLTNSKLDANSTTEGTETGRDITVFANGALSLEENSLATARLFTNAGTVDVTGSTVTATTVTNSGTFNVTGSTVTATSIANSGTVNVNAGTSTVYGGAVSGSGIYNLNDGAVLVDSNIGNANVFGVAEVKDSTLGTVQIGFETSTTTNDTLNLSGDVTTGNLYIGQADLGDAKGVEGWEERKYELNVTGGTLTAGEVYLRTNGTLNVDNAEVTTDYNILYGALNITNGATYTVNSANFYLVGPESKKALGKAIITVDNSTLYFNKATELGLGGGDSTKTGSGKLILKNSAEANGTSIGMKDNADGSLGEIAIESTDSTLNLTGYLSVGLGDSVTLTDSEATVGTTLTNKGTVNVTDSTLTATSVSNTGTFNISGTSEISGAFTGSELNLLGGTVVMNNVTLAQDLKVAKDATQTITGTVDMVDNKIYSASGLYVYDDGTNLNEGGSHIIIDNDAAQGEYLKTDLIRSGYGTVVDIEDGSKVIIRGFNNYGGTVNIKAGATVVEKVGGQNDFALLTGDMNVAGTYNAGYIYVYDALNANQLAGKLNVTGTVTTTVLEIGKQSSEAKRLRPTESGTHATANVSGATAVLNATTATIGSDTYTGTLNVESGATVNMGTVTVDTKGSVNLTGSTLTASGTFTSSGTVSMDATSTITVNAFAGTDGTITVDMTGASNAVIKLIDASEASNYGTKSFTVENGYRFVEEANDLYATKASITDLAVNHDWNDTAFGTAVTLNGTTYYYGINAFDNMADAADVVTSEATTITVGGDSAIVAGSSFADDQNVTITGTAAFDWNGGSWMYINYNASTIDPTAVTTVTFSGATITSQPSGVGGGDHSIHVSGAEKGSKKGNGILNVTNNSSVAAEWIINRNKINVDTGSTLTATLALVVHGRDASESPVKGGATAELNINNATVNAYGSSNGSGLVVGTESYGVVTLTNDAKLNANKISATEKATINVTDSTVVVGGTFANAGDFANGGTVSLVNSTMTATTVTNNGMFNVTGTSKISATTFSGNMNLTNGTELTTDGLTQTSGDVLIEDNGTVTLSGDGFDLNFIKNASDTYNNVTHAGYNLTIKDADSFKVYAIYDNGGSTVDVENVKQFDATVMNVYGGTLNVSGTDKAEYKADVDDNFNVTGEANFTKVSASAGILNVLAAPDGKLAGKFTGNDMQFDARHVYVGASITTDKYYTAGDRQDALMELTDSKLVLHNVPGEAAPSDLKVGGDTAVGTLNLTNSSVERKFTDPAFYTDFNVTVGAKGTVSLTDSTITADKLTNDGTITVDGTSSLSAATITSNGTFNLYKGAEITVSSNISAAITLSNAATYDFIKVASYTGSEASWYDLSYTNSGYYTVVDGNTAYATNAATTTYKVNEAWAGYTYGQSVGVDGYFYGYNAFSALGTALDSLKSDTTTVDVLSNLTGNLGASGEHTAIHQDLTISTSTVDVKSVDLESVPGHVHALIVDGGATLTLAENVNYTNCRYMFAGWQASSQAEKSGTLNIDGGLDTEMLWITNGGTINIGKTADVNLTYGDGMLTMRGDATLNVTGKNKSENLNGGYIQLNNVSGDATGGTRKITLNNTKVTSSWLKVWNDAVAGSFELSLTDADLILSGALNSGALETTITVDDTSKLYAETITVNGTSSDSITLKQGGVIGFETVTVKNKITLDGFTGSVDTPVLVMDYTGSGSMSMDDYEGIVNFTDGTGKFRVINSDLYYYADAKLYVNNGYTKDNCDNHTWGVDAFNNYTDAFAVADLSSRIFQTGGKDKYLTIGFEYHDVTIQGGTNGTTYGGVRTDDNKVLDNVHTKVTLESGTVSGLFGGNQINISRSSFTYLANSNTDVTISGGCVSSVLAAGDRAQQGFVEHIGNMDLTITGGTFTNVVGGGSYATDTVKYAGVVGNTTVKISGGSFAKTVYAGNLAQNDWLSLTTYLEGNASITVDSSENHITFKDPKNKTTVNLIAGSYGYGFIAGDTSLTFTGKGSNLTFKGTALGNSSLGYYKTESGKRTIEYFISGSSTVTFKNFTGNFDGQIKMFTNFELTGGSEVKFTHSNLNLDDVQEWDLFNDSTMIGIAGNDFEGDKLNFDLTGWDGQDWTVMEGTSQKAFANWNKAGVYETAGQKTTLDNHVIFEVGGNIYKSTKWDIELNGYSCSCGDLKVKVTVDDDNKMIVSKIA